jgi:hypothetical protein
VGDKSLLGRWLYFEDLGGWVLAADTGVVCTQRAKKKGCVAENQVDIFIGGPEMHRHALRMGVMEWTGKILEKEPQNDQVSIRREAVAAEVLP